MKPKDITVLIHTHNEEANIQECINSAKMLTERIILIDMDSTDRTIDIAKTAGATIASFPFSHYVEPARAFGIKQATTDWVFILDADERITEELSEEINEIMKNQELGSKNRDKDLQPTTHNQQPTYYKVPRKNIFGRKKWLKHGGWWPDHQMRFLRKDAFKKWPERIHSTPAVEGNMGYLENPIVHYFHGKIEQMVKKTMIFEDIESDLLFEAKRSVGTWTFFRKFFGELFRRLILKKGFMDGTIGIIESFYQAYSKTITYLFLYEKYYNQKKKSGSV